MVLYSGFVRRALARLHKTHRMQATIAYVALRRSVPLHVLAALAAEPPAWCSAADRAMLAHAVCQYALVASAVRAVGRPLSLVRRAPHAVLLLLRAVLSLGTAHRCGLEAAAAGAALAASLTETCAEPFELLAVLYARCAVGVAPAHAARVARRVFAFDSAADAFGYECGRAIGDVTEPYVDMHKFAAELAAALRAHPEQFVLVGAPHRSYLDNVDVWVERRDALKQQRGASPAAAGDGDVSAAIAQVLGRLDALQRQINSPKPLCARARARSKPQHAQRRAAEPVAQRARYVVAERRGAAVQQVVERGGRHGAGLHGVRGQQAGVQQGGGAQLAAEPGAAVAGARPHVQPVQAERIERAAQLGHAVGAHGARLGRAHRAARKRPAARRKLLRLAHVHAAHSRVHAVRDVRPGARVPEQYLHVKHVRTVAVAQRRHVVNRQQPVIVAPSLVGKLLVVCRP